MYLNNSDDISSEIFKSELRRNLNAAINNSITRPVDSGVIFSDTETLMKFAEQIKANYSQMGKYISDEKAIIASMAHSFFCESDFFRQFPDNIAASVLAAIMDQGKIFEKDAFADNAYLNDIHFESQQCQGYKLSELSFKKNEAFMYDEPCILPTGVEIPRIAAFNEEFFYPAIEKDSCTFKAVSPNEIFTMKKPLSKAAGKVLCLGCGMGYFAYMAGLKNKVEKLTIVENNPSIIKLFKDFILPQFSCRDKIEVIEADAFEYVKILEDGEYNFCFAQLWHGNDDALPYLRLKELCRGFRKMKISYWLEDSIARGLVGYEGILLMDEFCKNIAKPSIQPMLSEKEQEILAYLKKIFEDIRIETSAQLKEYEDYKTIIKLLS